MGEWGFSIIDQQPILVKGLTAFYLTLELCLVAFVTATIIAVPLGIIASMNKDTMLDKIIMTIALISLALPVFWLSVVLTLFPSSTSLPIPIDGDISPIYEFKNHTGFLLIDTLIATKSYQLDAFFSRLAHLFYLH
ncbi:ABC transporter permease subunit [Psychromonas sp. MME2]|uniref:ABC transporter permease subunit n=1 Tax=Psychromonas sp. MME2 TaxID=3231033 RepID=UPI00339BF55E